MGDATRLLFGLGGSRVVSVTRKHDSGEQHDGAREVVVEGMQPEQACCDCGVLSGAVHGRKLRLLKDLPHGRRPLRLRWDQRRWAWREVLCRRRTFAETSVQIGAGRRLTLRLREQLQQAVSGSTRSAEDVSREYGVPVVVGQHHAGRQGRRDDAAGAVWGSDPRGR